MRARPSSLARPQVPEGPALAAPWLLSVLSVTLVSLATSGCASSAAPAAAAAPNDVTVVHHVDKVTPPTPEAQLAGARCDGATHTCKCRADGDDAETAPPAEGQKRLEIRLSVLDGDGALESPTVGRFAAAGVKDTCYYVDLPAGSRSSWSFISHATNPGTGLSPRMSISEYGPKGPYWYEILSADCVGLAGKCDRAGSDAFRNRLKTRQRGRFDPCGSMVITGLRWDSSGGQSERDNGFYRDFLLSFDLDVKKFATQFAPNSTECIPK